MQEFKSNSNRIRFVTERIKMKEVRKGWLLHNICLFSTAPYAEHDRPRWKELPYLGRSLEN